MILNDVNKEHIGTLGCPTREKKISENINLLEDNLVTYENNRKLIQKAVSNLRVLKSE